jgi:hypothetical protein
MKARNRKKKITAVEMSEYEKLQLSPIYFVKVMWKLSPQPIRAEFQALVTLLITQGKLNEIKVEYFEPRTREQCFQEKLYSWQQFVILTAVELAIHGKAVNRISIRSGHGIGKSVVIAWLLLWYLYTHYLAQVNCTAPTGDQMYDVLWKAVSMWLKMMPPSIQKEFEWQANYIRMIAHPEAWFARARTARKEAPEALAGMHGENILALVDEASGVHEEIFNTMEGSLTDYKPMIVIISNPTRLVGYFYDSQKGQDAKNWQTFHFNSEESPFVDDEYVQRIIDKHGKDSDEYRIRVLGEFPREDAVDDQGYVPLLGRQDIRQINLSDPDTSPFVGKIRMGIDPAGEGKNKSVWTARDRFRAKVLLEEDTSEPKVMAQRTIGLAELYKIEADDVYVDMFGIGAEFVKELYRSGFYCHSVMVGDAPDDEEDQERFLNKRACFYFRLRKWIKSGGELERHKAWEEEITNVRYRRSSGHQRLQIMPKKEARSKGYHSPDAADSLMLTFTDDSEDYGTPVTVTPSAIIRGNKIETITHSNINLHSAI